MPEVHEVDLDWRSVAAVLAAFVALIALTGLIRSAPRAIAAALIASMLALALSPVVGAIERRLGSGRRPWAVIVVLTGIALGAVIALAVLAPPAIRQARDLPAELPSVVRDLGDLPVVGDDLIAAGVPERVQRAIENLPKRLSGDTTPLEDAGRSLAGGLFAASATLLLATGLLLDGPRLGRQVRAMVPESRRPQVDRAARLAYAVVGRYVAGSLTVAGVAGLYVLVVGLLLGVPLTPLAALWVALWDLVPQVGGAAGGIPFVLLGFTAGAGVGLACLVLFVLYLQVENHIIGPLLVGKAVKLSPPATMTAALIGVSAGGVVGALVAVPLVGATKAIYLEVRGGAAA